jgi:uncharacterized protein
VLTKSFKYDVKAAADASGQFSGRASVYGVVDSYNDVVMPGAFNETLKANGGRIVVLNQHNPSDPIGFATLSDSELSLDASGQLVLDLQSAKDAYTRLQNKLIDGISIGYEIPPGGDSYVGGVRQLNQIKLWEISLVTFPANSFARVTDVKRTAVGVVADLVKEFKAGRVLSAANRSKIQNAHGALSDATNVLQELLDLTDPDASDEAARQLLLTVKRSMLKVKDAQQIADSAAMVDQMIDALDVAFDGLLLSLGLPDAPDPDEAASKSLEELLADMRATFKR